MKVYFKADQVYNKTFYGYNIYMNDKLADSLYGVMSGTKDEVLNKITKNMLIKNNSVLAYDKLLTLKYENLDTTKQMIHTIKYDQTYQSYKDNNVSFMISPSVFLSDNIPMHQLSKGIERYKMMYNYQINKHNKTL